MISLKTLVLRSLCSFVLCIAAFLCACILMIALGPITEPSHHPFASLLGCIFLILLSSFALSVGIYYFVSCYNIGKNIVERMVKG